MEYTPQCCHACFIVMVLIWGRGTTNCCSIVTPQNYIPLYNGPNPFNSVKTWPQQGFVPNGCHFKTIHVVYSVVTILQ